MAEEFCKYGIAYATYALQAALLVVLLWRSDWKRLRSLTLYLAALLALDGLGRPYVLHRYGFSSHEYQYFYWITDILLTLCCFGLIYAFFRRACTQKERMWVDLRRVLVIVFILVLAISVPSLERNYKYLYGIFIVEFQQNLYFTCLVLNTLLYLFIRRIESTDEELGTLVCGMGVQLAGPAASFALISLMRDQLFARSLLAYVSPVCALGMLLIWFYAIVRTPQPASVAAPTGDGQALAEATANLRV